MNNKEIHLLQWDSNPKINNIIKKLIIDWFLSENISYKNWEWYSNEIIDVLREQLNKIKGRKKINLKVSLNDIELIDDEKYLDRIFDEKWLLLIEKQNRNLLKEIYVKKTSIERTIFSILDDTLHFRRHIMMFRSETLLSGIINLSKIEKIIEWIRREDKQKVWIIKDLDLNYINTELDKIIKWSKKKKWIIIEISLYLRDFLKNFIWRIDIFKDVIWKEDLIKKFEIRKDSKSNISWMYFSVSIFLFLLILWINTYKYFHVDEKSISFDKFIESFLWQNIYLFFTEIFIIILAFYFLSLFKTYRKIVELYDSHILLIESDFYYKNDEHFSWVDSNKLFDMRKENAQRIHLLPQRASEILNGKENSLKELPSIKLLESLWKILNSLVDKLSNKK